MKYNYEKMGAYADNYNNYVKDFQENCKNEYLRRTKIKVITQEQMVKNTGGQGLAYTDGQDIYIPELVRNQNIITTSLKDKNLQAKLIRAAFVLHELAHFEEDKPSSYLRTIYLECFNKVEKNYKYKELIENKDNIIDKFNSEIVNEVSEKFKVQYGKLLSPENYNKYVGIYLSKDLRKKNTVFNFYNRWVDRYIENQLPLLAKDAEDSRNVKSILHFLRYNLAKKDLNTYITHKKELGLVSRLTLLTSNYIDPRTRELFEEASIFDKDTEWQKYYQLNKNEIEKMYDVNRKLSNSYYGSYNNYVRNEKDIYSVHFNDAAYTIYNKILDEINQEQQQNQQNQQNQQQNQQQNGQQGQGQQSDGQGQDGQSSGSSGQGQQSDGQGQDGQSSGSSGQGQQSDGQEQSGQGSSSSGQGQQSDGQGQSGQGSSSSGQGQQSDGQGQSGQGSSSSGQGQQSDGQEQSGQGSNSSGQGQQSDGQGQDSQGSNSSGQGQDDKFTKEEIDKFKEDFKEDLNKKSVEEMIKEVLQNFEEKVLGEALKEAREKEAQALTEQNKQSFGKDAIPDQKGKNEKSSGQDNENNGTPQGGDNKDSEKKNSKTPKYEDSEFLEFVNYKSNTSNDSTMELSINKPKVNEMIINFEKLINENRQIKELIKKTKELLKSSTTKEKKRMTSGNHKKIVDRAIRGDIKIFNKFVSFDLGDLDIFMLIDNSGSMDESMKNSKIPFLKSRKDYSLFFRYLIKKIFEPLGANIDIKTFTTGRGYSRGGYEENTHRNGGITWENLQNIDDDDHTKRVNYDKIVQSKINGASGGTNLFAAFNEYVPMIRKHQYKNKKPILLFTVSDGDTSVETNEERNHSIYLNNLLEKDESIKHIKLCIDSTSLIKYFGATVEKTRYVQSNSKIIAIKNNVKSNISGSLKAKGNTVMIDNKVMGKSNDFSYIENFEDISKFMLDNLDSIFNIILNNGKQVISNHKGRTTNHNRKNLGPML